MTISSLGVFCISCHCKENAKFPGYTELPFVDFWSFNYFWRRPKFASRPESRFWSDCRKLHNGEKVKIHGHSKLSPVNYMCSLYLWRRPKIQFTGPKSKFRNFAKRFEHMRKCHFPDKVHCQPGFFFCKGFLHHKESPHHSEQIHALKIFHLSMGCEKGSACRFTFCFGIFGKTLHQKGSRSAIEAYRKPVSCSVPDIGIFCQKSKKGGTISEHSDLSHVDYRGFIYDVNQENLFIWSQTEFGVFCTKLSM